MKIPTQPASQDIWEKKYQLKDKNGHAVDKTMDDTFKRVARALADIEPAPQDWYEQFLFALRSGAIPAGRIISNAGAEKYKPATSTINCTVSGTIHDSMDGILTRVHQAGITLKAGSGIGYEFSTLRPRGAYVSGAGATTSGPLSFMDIYDKMCFTVSSAGGRRGAQMATFDVGHPDVVDFIKAKREDGRLRQFNLSLLITRNFMEAVKADAMWPLVFPMTQAEYNDYDGEVVWRRWPVTEGYVTSVTNLVACKVYKKIKAKELWDLIMESTYDFAEPGFILIDEANNKNNTWWCEDIRATNPCVTADTWVKTTVGTQQVADLIGKQFAASVNGKGYLSGEEGFFLSGVKPVVEVQTNRGYKLRLTENHLLRRVKKSSRYELETEWCAVSDLRTGDKLVLNNHRDAPAWDGDYEFTDGYLLGLLLGDGTLKPDGTAVISIWRPDANLDKETNVHPVDNVMAHALRMINALPHKGDVLKWHEIAERKEFRISSAALNLLAASLGLTSSNKTITPAMEKTSSEFHNGLLRGLFDTDGSVQGGHSKGGSVRLSQSNLPLLEAAQRMLLRLGIASTIYRDRRVAGKHSLPDGKGGKKEYNIKAQHELVISGDNLVYFHALVGFYDTAKATKLAALLDTYKRKINRERFVTMVDSITLAGVEPVYDVQIYEANAFDANGFHAHNCGEQPLPPFGACLLGSINLTHYVLDPFTSGAVFNFSAFRNTVAIFTRMLDNVVEINGLPLPEQRDEIIRKRRHGMGYLGLGSALAMLGIKYGSPEAVEFAEGITRELAITGWRTGLELAKEKGPAPIMEELFTVTAEMLHIRPEMAADGYQIGDRVPGKILFARYSRYMQQIARVEPYLVNDLAEFGCRFTHHSSIAPTGTISLSLANNASNGIEPSFAHHYSRNVIREGKKSKEKVDVYSYELLAYRARKDKDALDNLPDYFVQADTITPLDHIRIQAAAQKWIDSSISKTINIPTEYPYADFSNVYMEAYAAGLKGCTTFRYNPTAFQGVLVKEKDLAATQYRFTLENGEVVTVKGNEELEYDGEKHSAANLYDALKEGYYGKF